MEIGIEGSIETGEPGDKYWKKKRRAGKCRDSRKESLRQNVKRHHLSIISRPQQKSISLSDGWT